MADNVLSTRVLEAPTAAAAAAADLFDEDDSSSVVDLQRHRRVRLLHILHQRAEFKLNQARTQDKGPENEV